MTSAGSWIVESPIGDLYVRRDGTGWFVSANVIHTPEHMGVSLWAKLTGLNRIRARTRRELVSIIAQTIERYPETPTDLWRKEYEDERSA